MYTQSPPSPCTSNHPILARTPSHPEPHLPPVTQHHHAHPSTQPDHQYHAQAAPLITISTAKHTHTQPSPLIPCHARSYPLTALGPLSFFPNTENFFPLFLLDSSPQYKQLFIKARLFPTVRIGGTMKDLNIKLILRSSSRKLQDYRQMGFP